MINTKELQWITSDPNDVRQFRQTSWRGITIRIDAIELNSCKVFVSGGGESKQEDALAPCDAVTWGIDQAESIYKDYVDRRQKDVVATIEAVDKCIDG